MLRGSVTDLMFRKGTWGPSNMEEIPPGFRPCLSCTQSCYKEHWPFPNRDSFRAPCFVKALCDSNLAAMATCWMVIPSAWLKLYGDDVGNSAILLGPSGSTWQVGVSRPKWVAFRVGWRTFAADNCLEKGDMLVFTLIGKSRFAVKIFDCRTCLEKESSLTATNTGCYDSRSPVLLGEKRKVLQRDGSDTTTTTTDLKRICLSTSTENNIDSVEFPRNGNMHGGLPPPPIALSMFNSILQSSQRKCSLLDLNSKPHLSIQQHQHHSPLPCDSGRSSFPEVNQQLLDAVDDRSLQEYASAVVYQPHPISIRSHDFDDECSPQSQSKTQECGSGGIGPATRFAAQRRPVMDHSTTRERNNNNNGHNNNNNNNSELYHCRQNSISALVTSDPSSQVCQALDLNRHHFPEAAAPQILSPAVILERGKALELARRAQDGIDRPSHLVVLRAFHVHGRAFVRFPVTFGKQHMPRKTAPMHLLDANGHRWPMTWLRDNETHMGLTRGWRDFCLAEGLSEGDVCLFELIEFNKLTLLVHVFRSTEPRDANTQVIIHQKPSSESRRKHNNNSNHHPRSRDRDREKQAANSMDDNKPCKMVLYNKFHRTRPLSREYSSVGRVRLQKLSLWASKADDLELSKAQDTAYGEILCQMSSGENATWRDNNNNNNHEDGPHGHHHVTVVKNRRRKPQRAKLLPRSSLRKGDYSTKVVPKPTCASSQKKRKLQRFYVASKRASVTQTQRDAAKEAALSLVSHNRTALVVMKNSNVYNIFNLRLPTSFCRHLSAAGGERIQNNNIVLTDAAGGERIQNNNIVLTDAAGAQTKAQMWSNVITRGWRQFSLEHLLEEGDVCVFEFIAQSNVIRVHIFRVIDINVDHHRLQGGSCSSYRSHYRFISLGGRRNPVKKRSKSTSTLVNKSLYLAIQKTRAKTVVDVVDCKEQHQPRLDLNHPAHLSPPLSIDSPSRCAVSKRSLEVMDPDVDNKTTLDNNNKPGFQQFSISHNCHNNELLGSLDVDCGEDSYKNMSLALVRQQDNEDDRNAVNVAYSKEDIYETTSSTVLRQQITSHENDKMIMCFPRDRDAQINIGLAYPSDDDSEREEENYYRVVRIVKKRYFQNEKQYLTELDGPLMQTSIGCKGIWDHDDIKWWVPEKSFSSGFASCYLR